MSASDLSASAAERRIAELEARVTKLETELRFQKDLLSAYHKQNCAIPASPSADHQDSPLCGESLAGTGGHSLDELKARAADLGIDLLVTHECPAIPARQFDYSAIDALTYDGAPDSSNRHHIGRGPTPESAVRALFEILGIDEVES